MLGPRADHGELQCDVAAGLAPIFCVFDDFDGVLAGRQALHAVFAAEFVHAHGLFFIDADFNVVAVFATQYGVIKDKIGVSREAGSAKWCIDFDEGVRHAEAVAVWKVNVRIGAGTEEKRAKKYRGKYGKKYSIKRGWPSTQHGHMMT